MGYVVERILDERSDQSDRANWKMVWEDKEGGSKRRYWFVNFPKGEQCRARLIVEQEWDGRVFDLTDNYAEVEPFTIKFWYDARRISGDW